MKIKICQFKLDEVNINECSTIITHWRHCKKVLQADSCQRFIFQNAHALLFKLF